MSDFGVVTGEAVGLAVSFGAVFEEGAVDLVVIFPVEVATFRFRSNQLAISGCTWLKR